MNVAPLVSDGAVLVLGEDGRIHARELATGAERWAWPDLGAGGGRAGLPAVVDSGTVYLTTPDDWMYAVDAATGASLWRWRYYPERRPSEQQSWGIARIAARAGVVYLADYDILSGQVLAVSPDGGRRKSAPPKTADQQFASGRGDGVCGGLW